MAKLTEYQKTEYRAAKHYIHEYNGRVFFSRDYGITIVIFPNDNYKGKNSNSVYVSYAVCAWQDKFKKKLGITTARYNNVVFSYIDNRDYQTIAADFASAITGNPIYSDELTEYAIE